MRPSEINSLFRVSDLGDVCLKLADEKPLLDNFGEAEAGKAHGRLLTSLEEFFERRNGIAHSLNPARSSGPDQILKDIEMIGYWRRGHSWPPRHVGRRAARMGQPRQKI
jgi:hypothetical protein